MNALKEMMVLALLAPLAPLFFVLGLFEVKWAVQLMNLGANLKYTPTHEELNLLDAIVMREKEKLRARRVAFEDISGSRTNPDTGFTVPGNSTIDVTGNRIGGTSNDLFD